MKTNEITIDLEEIEKMEIGSIKDGETIRQLSLQSIGSGDISLLTRINPMFSFAGLYPHAISMDVFSKPKVEYERRFLLKRVPNHLKMSRMINIEQFYGNGSRYRKSQVFEGPGSEDGRMGQRPTYVKEIKSTLGFGMNSETPEVPLTYNQFKNLIKTCDRSIEKDRHIWENAGRVWEIDEFRFARIIICEVEAKSEEDLKSITVPPELAEYVIKEITGEKEFSNFNLASPRK